MAHDFANKRSAKSTSGKRKTGTKTSTKKNNNGHWSSFFTGLLSGLFIAFIGYLGFIKPQAPTAQAPTQNTDPSAAPVVESSATDNLIFYTYLPDAEVLVDVETVEIPAENAEVEVETNPLSYRLQAGSFQNRQDAENRRSEVILLNMDANIVPGIVSGKTWHRVQVGPFTGRSNVNTARDMLSLNNIDTIVLLVR